MGTKYKNSKINYCKWCGAKTNLDPIKIPETPILEFLEEKINKLGRNKVWGESSNWAYIEMDPDIEAELLVYDEMLNTISYKHICEKCVEEDNRLYDKYYNDDEEITLHED